LIRSLTQEAVVIRRGINWPRVAWIGAALWLGYLVVLPIAYMVVDAFTEEGLSLGPFRDFFSDGKLMRASLNSLLVATGVAILSVLVGAPLAFGVARISRSEPSSLLLWICTVIAPPDFCSTNCLKRSVATGIVWEAG